jgi:CDP-diacylglycerol--serine O-phosphatidyltransferase
MSGPQRARAFPILEHVALANAITLLSAALGVSGILLCAHERALAATLCGVVAIPCDVLDGAVARRRGTTGPFGAMLDTLADATSFCLLPALIGHALGLPTWAAPLQVVYALAGILRLSRFSVVGTTAGADARETFEGFPTPFVAACFYVVAAAAVWLPARAEWAPLAGFYALAPLALLSGVRVSKYGLHTRAMWILVPLAAAALSVRLM